MCTYMLHIYIYIARIYWTFYWAFAPDDPANQVKGMYKHIYIYMHMSIYAETTAMRLRAVAFPV